MNGHSEPLIAHSPFIIENNRVLAHFMHSNPMLRALGEGHPAILSVMDCDAYISPDWYGMADQVPTWNYVAILIKGFMKPLPASDLPELLDKLSEAFEARLAPKPIWRMEKMTAETRARMLRMILPIQIEIQSVESTLKLGQNKPPSARQAAASGVTVNQIGSEAMRLAAKMRDI